MPQYDSHPSFSASQQFPFIASYKEGFPWTASLFEHFYRFSLDLASTGASAAIAKTAIAPLDRAKVWSNIALPFLKSSCSGLVLVSASTDPFWVHCLQQI